MNGFTVRLAFSSMLACIVCIVSASGSPAQPPPGEHASKVKRVMLYGKIGGWLSPDAVTEVKRVFRQMSVAKGFILDTASDESALTPENLARYQVIVWNNNSNAGASVNNIPARSALIEYVKGGGGWMLVGLAGEHADSWTDLSALLGSRVTRFLGPANADIRADSSAKRHPELRHVVSAIPDTVRLWNEWFILGGNARPLSGVTVLYTAGNGDAVSLPPGGSEGADYPYVWVREVGKGKLLYNALGPWAGNAVTVATQADSAVTKLYWQSLRWLAGDFRNGCTDPGSPLFDPDARIDDGSCGATGVRSGPRGGPRAIPLPGRRFRLEPRAAGAIAILRDVKGAKVREIDVPAGTEAVAIDAAVLPGMYLLEIRGGSAAFRGGAASHYRLLLP